MKPASVSAPEPATATRAAIVEEERRKTHCGSDELFKDPIGHNFIAPCGVDDCSQFIHVVYTDGTYRSYKPACPAETADGKEPGCAARCIDCHLVVCTDLHTTWYFDGRPRCPKCTAKQRRYDAMAGVLMPAAAAAAADAAPAETKSEEKEEMDESKDDEDDEDDDEDRPSIGAHVRFHPVCLKCKGGQYEKARSKYGTLQSVSIPEPIQDGTMNLSVYDAVATVRRVFSNWLSIVGEWHTVDHFNAPYCCLETCDGNGERDSD